MPYLLNIIVTKEKFVLWRQPFGEKMEVTLQIVIIEFNDVEKSGNLPQCR